AAQEHELASVHGRPGARTEPHALIEVHIARIRRCDDVHTRCARVRRSGCKFLDQRCSDTAAAELWSEIDVQMGRELPCSGREVLKTAPFIERADEIAGNGTAVRNGEVGPL